MEKMVMAVLGVFSVKHSKKNWHSRQDVHRFFVLISSVSLVLWGNLAVQGVQRFCSLIYLKQINFSRTVLAGPL